MRVAISARLHNAIVSRSARAAEATPSEDRQRAHTSRSQQQHAAAGGSPRGLEGATAGQPHTLATTRAAAARDNRQPRTTGNMYHPEWGQSKWSGQLRKTHWQGHPDEFWTSGPSAHAATFRPGSRQCTPREAMSASERLYRNEKRYSRRSGRYRSATAAGCDPYARRAAQTNSVRRAASTVPPIEPSHGRGRAAAAVRFYGAPRTRRG